ncbi:DUF5925 domain-containing protein [Blastococcus saxobsidens]|uniref:Putative AAA+ family ATPase n=1 Tax=Blastococcus saxobsidens (strain DD2) TaxID=1146883 RepID=H6RT25_BLASD|nr:DUF5925 domain-containing protein [Blastococcus saxobsidens]CCG04328.1 Putative AAA+ family ATPase [Blastococcus saxobsidens DD2]
MTDDPALPPPHRFLQPGLWLDRFDLAGGMLLQAQWDGGMPYQRTGEVTGAAGDPLDLLPEEAVVRLDRKDGSSRAVVVALPGLLAKVEVQHRMTTVEVVGANVSAVEELVAHVVAGAELVATAPEGEVQMAFWSYAQGGGSESSRHVTAPAWADAAANYAGRTRQSLVPLMAARDMSGRVGRLVLWHGEPGTGKTTAVRALSREWADWCRPHYVMDPERLFAEPQYLLQVAGIDEDEDDDGRWRLVVAEDCDDYLRSDAKARAGASLGRLLNLCDGILGHGLQVLVLLTTNEDVGRLHPAVTRPGRCLSQVEFERLSPAEAQAWLGGSTDAPERPMTLAELYAIREERTHPAHAFAQEVGGYL